MELVRAAALTAYFPVARELGLDPAPLLREAGLTRALLQDPEQMLSAEAVTTLLDRSAEVSDCVTFGRRQKPLSTGILPACISSEWTSVSPSAAAAMASPCSALES